MVDFTVPFHLQFAVSLCDIIHYSRKKKISNSFKSNSGYHINVILRKCFFGFFKHTQNLSGSLPPMFLVLSSLLHSVLQHNITEYFS